MFRMLALLFSAYSLAPWTNNNNFLLISLTQLGYIFILKSFLPTLFHQWIQPPKWNFTEESSFGKWSNKSCWITFKLHPSVFALFFKVSIAYKNIIICKYRIFVILLLIAPHFTESKKKNQSINIYIKAETSCERAWGSAMWCILWKELRYS